MATTYDDLLARLRLMYESVKQISAIELRELTTEVETSSDGRSRSMSMDTNAGTTPERRMLLAMSTTHTVSVFYDHCKDFCKSNGMDPKTVDAAGLHSAEWRLIRDLDNKNKHPQMTAGSSGQYPKLENVNREFILRGPGTGGLSFNLATGEMKMVGKMRLEIEGDIVNGSTGQHLMKLSAALEASVALWETFLKTHRILKT